MINAAPTNAISATKLVPFATLMEAAAPPAGGAAAALVAPADAELPGVRPFVAETVTAELAAPEWEEVTEAIVALPEKLAEGPTALADTVDTAPVIVIKLLITLATVIEDVVELAATADDEEGVADCGNVTWMRISSHCAPIHVS